VWVANTDGGGVYLSNSPHIGDRSSSVLAENTPLTVTGELTEGDGQIWYPVATQDGSTGYVPATYTTQTDPEAPRLPLAPGQTR
jgi:Bacterial SH3 domain